MKKHIFISTLLLAGIFAIGTNAPEVLAQSRAGSMAVPTTVNVNASGSASASGSTQSNAASSNVATSSSRSTITTGTSRSAAVAIPLPPQLPVCPILSGHMGQGSSDVQLKGQVALLQKYLQDNNYLNPSLQRGYFGTLTKAAVARFQAKNGIQATGYVGPLTLEKLKLVMCDQIMTENNLPMGITLTATTDKKTYAQDEVITVTLTARNTSIKDRTITFNNGCQTSYAIAGYDSRIARLCIMMLGSLTIKAGESHSWTITHDPATYEIPVGYQVFTARIDGVGHATATITITESKSDGEDRVTVVSPNGGETYREGREIDIVWNTPHVTYIQAPRYDIRAIPEPPACTKVANPPCVVKLATYIIGENVIGSSGTSTYSWNVGDVVDGTLEMPKGYFKIQICEASGSSCDESDEYFRMR